MEGQHSLDRREFIKGIAVAGGGVALAGLGACSSGDSQEPPAGGDGDGGVTTGMKHTWEVPPAAITEIAKTGDYDIVIVGAGIAGNAAAESAAAAGARVAVLEQMETFSARGVDNGHIGSKWQKAQGRNIDPVTAAKLEYRWGQYTTNYDLMLTWATRSGTVFDHLEELGKKYGLTMVTALSPTAKTGWDEFDEVWRVYSDAVSFIDGTENGMMTADGKWVQHNIVNSLNQEAVAHGAEFFYKIHAEQLVTGDDGGVTGVIATAEDGSHVQYNAAKGVILATGCIGGNQEMIDVWAPIVKRADGGMYEPAGGNKGEGILMGMWIGAAHSKSPAAPMVHQIDFTGVLTAFQMSWLAVNRLGRRYGAELPFEPVITNARMNQPGNVSWSIFDSNYAVHVQAQYPESYQAMLDGVPTKIDELVESEHIVKGGTLAELAEQLGIPVDTFEETVARYNSMCAKGIDDDFGVPARFLASVETAPFYAQKVSAMLLTIPFGLHVNSDSQVCKEDDTPIPGLFAVGNVQGDFFGNSYPVHCPGISHGRALTFGNLVGQALAKDTVITKTM